MHYQKLIETLISTNAVTAIKYLSPTEVIKATRKRFNGKFSKKGIDIVLTIGKPNFKERKFVKDCQKAGEKFPVQKIQIKPLPVKKK